MGPYYDAISLMIERLPEPHQTPASRYRGLAPEAPPTAASRRLLSTGLEAIRSFLKRPRLGMLRIGT